MLVKSFRTRASFFPTTSDISMCSMPNQSTLCIVTRNYVATKVGGGGGGGGGDLYQCTCTTEAGAIWIQFHSIDIGNETQKLSIDTEEVSIESF